jgi:hypothetical protein
MLHIVYELSTVDASTFGRGANCYTTNLGQEDHQSIFWTSKLCPNLKKNPFHSAYSITELLSVSHTTILNHLRDSLGMQLFHLRWLPHGLSEQLRAVRVQKCQELLPLLEGIRGSRGSP